MRTPLALFLALLLAPGAATGAALVSPETPSAPDLLEDLLATTDAFQRVAQAYPQGAGLADSLQALTGIAPRAPMVAGTDVSFDEALRALYAAAGRDTSVAFDTPDAAVADALVPVLLAMVEASQQVDAAFSDLTADERAFLLANLEIIFAPNAGPDGDALAADVQALAARVDMPKLMVGALAISVAIDQIPDDLVTVGPIAASWVDPNGILEIGSTGNDAYFVERLLIVDLGGNDLYSGSPASYAPGSSLPLPMSIIVDLGGNDRYETTMLHPSSITSTWGQGVGLGGIGLIADRWGDDQYETNIRDMATFCSNDFYEGAPQYVYAQAVGALGVGAILDASGNDQYLVTNVNKLNLSCHFGWAFAFSQGMGFAKGVGLLVDGEGDDLYSTDAESTGKYDSMAAVYTQAAAAGGIGALVDKEGSDTYRAQAYGHNTDNVIKGAFGYVFSQASVAFTNKQPSPSSLGLSLDFAGGSALCSREGGTPAPTGAGVPCVQASAAFLLDVLGDDTFLALPSADDGNLGCYNGMWAVSSSQGSAASTGLALLLNLDVEGSDLFRAAPESTGRGCGGPGVRAHSYGQGYGGSILWNFWDAPTYGGNSVAIGILASVGIPEEKCTGDIETPRGGPIPVIYDLQPVIVQDACRRIEKTQPAPRFTASPDAYESTPRATSPLGPGTPVEAHSWVQGAATDRVNNPWMSQSSVGVGLNIDVGGDDSYIAQATATGGTADAFVGAQAATHNTFAGLLNVGGSDRYFADAIINGASTPKNTEVQGYAVTSTSVTTPNICVNHSIVLVCINSVAVAAGGVAVFIDAFGEDSYSEAPERFGCQANGTLLGNWPTSPGIGAIWWGTVIGSPCATPTPDVGNGTVIGLDWWSEAHA